MVDSQLVSIYAIKLDHHINRVFVLKDNSNVVCHHEKCKDSRVVHMTSAVLFSCACIAATEKSSEFLSAKILTSEDILAYKQVCNRGKVVVTSGSSQRFSAYGEHFRTLFCHFY